MHSSAKAGSESLGALLLAAGSSKRLGQPKQLLTVDGEPLVRRQARLLLELQTACTVVVTGAAEAGVRAALDGLDVLLVHNPAWQQGMGGSLACGIHAMPERVRGALLLLVDQYRVDRDDLARMAVAWAADPLAAVSASWDAQRGPPVIFPRSLFERVARLEGERGAWAVLRRFRGRQIAVPMPNAAFDLDTPDDLASLAER
jgi:CTP:molybdopterin cytidylyltransferase MocA